MKRILILFLLIASFNGYAQLQLPFPIKLVNPKPVDYFYYESDGTPYDNTTEVTTQVVSASRYIGQTFNVNGAEYWFASGILDVDLVAKGGGGGITTASNGLTKVINDVQFGGTLTAPGLLNGNFNDLSITGLNNFNISSVANIFNGYAFFNDPMQVKGSAAAAALNLFPYAGDPGTPANGDLWYNSTSNELKARINGATVALGAGGGGVTSVSALSPLFTTSNPTTTPTFTAVNQNANLFYGGASTGAASAPTFRALTNYDLPHIRRTVTGTGAITQADDQGVIYFNSASPINFTIDQLIVNSGAEFINKGSGTVTFLNGTGVTIVGGTTLTAGSVGNIRYDASTTPIIVTSDGSGIIVGTSAITAGTSTRVLYNNAGVLGEYPVTGTANVVLSGTPTIATPNITTGFTIGGAAINRKIMVGNGTNFVPSTETYAIPGTSGNVLTSDGTNWVSAASTGGWATSGATSIVGAATITDNIENGLNFSHTFAATGNNSYAVRENGSLTFRNTVSDQLYFKSITPSFTIAANDQKAIALRIAPTWTNGAFATPANIGLAVETGSSAFGNPLNAVATTTRVQIMGTSTGSDIALSIRDNVNNIRWNFRSDGVLAMLNPSLYSPLNLYGNSTTGIQFEGGTITSTGTASLFRVGSVTRTSTNGTHTDLEVTSAFNPTSGAAGLIGINVKPIINQTSTASGTTIGIQYNPQLISILGTNYGILSIPTNALNGFGTSTPTSTLTTAGSFAGGYVSKSANYTATVNDFMIECTTGTFQVTLPTAAGISGRIYHVANSGAGTITVATTSSQTFVNVTATPTTLTLSVVGNITVMSNGANWIQIK